MIEFQPAPASVPDGVRVYAVGDVHGCLDRLRALHALIAEDLAARPVTTATLVHLGDYIDRGPGSAGVLRLVADGPPPAGITETANLMGNHEAMMLNALERGDEDAVGLWLMNGGYQTLVSFGLERVLEAAGWAERLEPEPLGFVRRLALTHRAGGYVFVHAGIRPGVPLPGQAREDLLWMREPFLSSSADFGAVIVHGHTIRRTPELRPNRIGIDTGAVMGGNLTCAVLEADRVGFLAV
ncbi:MAG: metallophosphoesterase family protein [Acetobacteraceae bacterium]